MFSSGAIGYAFLAKIALLIASYDFVFETANAQSGAREEAPVESPSASSSVQQIVLPSRSEVRRPLTKSG